MASVGASESDKARRITILGVVAGLMGAALLGRLAYMQLYEGSRFQKQAEGNRLRVIPYPAPRGVIRDRHGRVLAANRQSYALALYPTKLPKEGQDDLFSRLKELAGVQRSDIEARLNRQGRTSARPVKIKYDLDPTTIARVAERLNELPGVAIEPDTVRLYPKGQLLAHVLGYTGEVTDDELQKARDDGRQMRPGEIIGKTGIERRFDAELRGVNGAQEVEVDARGRPIQTVRTVEPVPGKDLKLFIDLELQSVAEQALDEGHYRGAVVAIDPRNGEVLAMASRPTYDPNLFTRKIDPEAWRKLQALSFPFVNRAFSAYPPGSIWKIPMSLAALETGVATPESRFNSTGSLRVGNRVFHDWTSRGFGVVNLAQGLQWSIDTVYYELGVKMGGERMARYAREFGLGAPTGIELPGESKGLVPDPEWKKRVYHDRWWPGDSANMSIGQGAVSVTPLQAAVMLSALANGGKLVVPRLTDRPDNPPQIKATQRWAPKNVDYVRYGTRLVVSSGTGSVADIPGKGIAGKTGSAESGQAKTHSWFVAYGPTPNPTISLVVFCEAAGHGGSIAAPIARKVLDQYFGTKGKSVPRAPAALD